MQFSTILVIALAVVFTAAETKARFDNYQLFGVDVETTEQVQELQQLENVSVDGYMFWNELVAGRQLDLMVAPHNRAHFSDLMKNLNLKYKLKVNNVQSLIDDEQPKTRSTAFDWKQYQTYEEIYEWLDTQLATYPTVLKDVSIGQTYLNRTIRAVHLSHKAGNPAIILEANVHAREWVTSATATWWLNELLTSQDPIIRDLAENIDWYIIPIYNLDGFEYSHRVNRLWRKSRYPHAHLCLGADINRNFDFHWMVNSGASQNPCSETYAGPTPFSEVEAVALAKFVEAHAAQTKIYLSFHTYGQYILFPYGHTYDTAPNHDLMQTIADKMKEAFALKYNTDYIAGSTSNALYIASGTTVDWAYGVQNISVGYTLELRDRRGGPYGFVLPASQILPNCEETRDAIVAMVAEARRQNVL